jgi:hypothetical protein
MRTYPQTPEAGTSAGAENITPTGVNDNSAVKNGPEIGAENRTAHRRVLRSYGM